MFGHIHTKKSLMITHFEIPSFTYPNRTKHNVILGKVKKTPSQTEDGYKLAQPPPKATCFKCTDTSASHPTPRNEYPVCPHAWAQGQLYGAIHRGIGCDNKDWNQPRCAPRGDRLSKLWHIHTMECHKKGMEKVFFLIKA